MTAVDVIFLAVYLIGAILTWNRSVRWVKGYEAWQHPNLDNNDGFAELWSLLIATIWPVGIFIAASCTNRGRG